MMTDPARHDALVDVVVISAQLFGGLTPDRKETLVMLVCEHPAFAGIDALDIDHIVDQATKRIPSESPMDHLRGLVPSVLDRRLVVSVMIIVAMADSRRPQHNEQLLSATTALGMDRRDVENMIAKGLPDDFDSSQTKPALEETYLDVLLAAAASDGCLADEEMETLVGFACSRMELSDLPRGAIEDLMRASLQGFLDHGFSHWLSGIGDDLSSTQQRQTAYRLAAEMVAADARIVAKEIDFMDQLRDALSIDPDWAKTFNLTNTSMS